MKTPEIVLPRLEKLFTPEMAQKLPPYIQLAQKVGTHQVNTAEGQTQVKDLQKIGVSVSHQTQYYALYPLNKPISKMFNPQSLVSIEE